MKSISKIIAAMFASIATVASHATDNNQDKLWQATYAARQQYFESKVGRFPQDILKMMNMTAVWPGGGLFIIPTEKFDSHLAAYTTFGLTNPDMPTNVRMTEFHLENDGKRATSAKGQLQKKEPAVKPIGFAGYGYEIMVLTKKGQTWPLGFLQWAVQAEINNDVGLLERVEKYNGLTVEKINTENGLDINVLIVKANPPLPTQIKLPNGKMEVLIAIVITDEEMLWSQKNGRSALLKKLIDAGVGQISHLNRTSVINQ